MKCCAGQRGSRGQSLVAFAGKRKEPPRKAREQIEANQEKEWEK